MTLLVDRFRTLCRILFRLRLMQVPVPPHLESAGVEDELEQPTLDGIVWSDSVVYEDH